MSWPVGKRHTPEARAKISNAARQQWQDPVIRKKHVDGLSYAMMNETRPGAIGQPQTQIMLDFAKVLCPAGYLMDEIRIPLQNKVGGCYRLDFAHPEAKVNIEIDGEIHTRPYRRRNDELRDEHLRSLGWKVIRIRM